MKQREFIIPGKPMGKQRPFFKRGAKFIKPHTRAKTVSYEKLVIEEYKRAYSELPMLEGSIETEVNAYYPITESWSGKWEEWIRKGEYYPEGKPDWDNIGKIVCDALNEVAYHDDSKISDGIVHKRFAIDSEPRVEVKLKQIFDNPHV